MDAERLILETDASGNLKHVPKLPPNKRVEAVFLMIGDASEEGFREKYSTSSDRGRAMAAALAKVAEGRTFNKIDPVVWQRDIRQERVLPKREP
jgi:hypothetical protein